MNRLNRNQSFVVLVLIIAAAIGLRGAVIEFFGVGEARKHHTGWHKSAVAPLRAWASSQPPFLIVDAQGNAVEQNNAQLNVRLFEIKRMANGGDLVNGPQLTGDCTSWAVEHAIETTLASQVLAGKMGFSRVFPTFNYAVGRVEIWKPTLISPMPSEGCSVSAVCKGAQQRGFISWDEAEQAGYKYSGQLANQWGRSGPPRKLYAIAERHKVSTFAPMRSAEDVRDAICNGYGVCFGSDFTWQKYKTVDGRIVAIDCTQQTPERNRCGHAMCCDGYDGSTGNGPFYHIQNSWYPESHPKPIDGSPVCGFWIDQAGMEYIVSKDDCFAISAAESFQSQAKLFNDTPPVRASSPSKTLVAP